MSRVPLWASLPNPAKAVLTDVQFWIPVSVLLLGVALLVWLN